MLLATWNVNSVRVRLPRVVEFLQKHRPDALLMQETKADPGAFPHLELEAEGYRVADHSGGRWAGVAIAARADLGLTDVRTGLPGEPDAGEARWIEATVAGVRLASVYVPNGREVGSPTFVAKLAFLEAMAGRAAELAAAPAMVAGDMNVCPTDADVYDPAAFVGSTHVTPEERERLGRVLAAGLVDAYRALHPGRCWLHVVGLSPGPLPSRPRPADRSRPRERGARPAAAVVRDRPRLPQGAEAVRPRAAPGRARTRVNLGSFPRVRD